MSIFTKEQDKLKDDPQFQQEGVANMMGYCVGIAVGGGLAFLVLIAPHRESAAGFVCISAAIMMIVSIEIYARLGRTE